MLMGKGGEVWMCEYEDAWVMTAQLNEKKDGCELCLRPLVLCKDCKHILPKGFCHKHSRKVTDNWFCADGERNET